MRALPRIAGGVGLALLVAWLSPAARGEDAADDRPGLDYAVTIAGVPDGDLHDLLQAASQLVALTERPPESLARLRFRAQADIARLTKALHSRGYYDGKVEVATDETARPVAVTLTVTPGPQYRLESFRVRLQDGDAVPADAMPLLSALPIRIGGPALAADIMEAESQVVRHLREQGYPFAERRGHEARIFRDRQAMTVVVMIAPGPRARFGRTTITGLDRVEPDYVRRLLPWQPGERYDAGKVQAARRQLGGSPLFGSASVTEAGTLAPDGSLPITVEVREAEARSIGFGLSYSTDVGPGGDVFWQHRNLFGEGERLNLSLRVATIEQVARAEYRDESLLDGRYTLLGDFTAANRELNAFDERSILLGAALEWPFARLWRARAGATMELQEIADETDDEEEQRFLLFGAPLALTRDAANDRLNPTRGSRFEATLTPYAGAGDGPLAFVIGTVGGSAYRALDPAERFVLAGRVRLGGLLGEETDDIPANKRFYAGGGGSIRGYEFQTVGPLDEDGDPLGGRSLLEVSGELRIRITETIGIVPFVDGGTVFDSALPAFDEEIRWGAGIGLRYYTAIGPLRADVAVPLNKRRVDDDFQFYVSIGQSF